MLTSRRLWEQVGRDFYDYIVVDEAHHGTAASYRPIFDNFAPQILLGLTATPERMDGDNVAADFGNRFAAEIRLPEALEEKLLCPFHYFGVADPIASMGTSSGATASMMPPPWKTSMCWIMPEPSSASMPSSRRLTAMNLT